MSEAAVVERTETSETPNPDAEAKPNGTLPDEQATEESRAAPAAETTEAPKDAPVQDPEALRREGEERERQRIAREAKEAERRTQAEQHESNIRGARQRLTGEIASLHDLADEVAPNNPELAQALRTKARGLEAAKDNLSLHSVALAKFELGDSTNATVRTQMAAIEASFDAALPEKDRAAFVEATTGKPFSEWPKALLDVSPPSAKQTAAFVDDLVTHGSAALPEGEERTAFEAEVKGAKNAKAVVDALYKHARAVESRTPGETPAARERGTTAEPNNFREASEMFAGSHESGRKINIRELRSYERQFSSR